MALREDWRRQLTRCRAELGFRHVRFHGLLSDDMGTLICHRNAYLDSYFNADAIFDFLLSIGMRPFVELSFMPLALASGGKTVFHYKANVTPPRDYREWGRFIGRLVSHFAARYGAPEVREWFFEVWNEPNLKNFWAGSQKDYFRLYRATAAAIKDVDGGFLAGGPATAQNAWIEEFVNFCERERVPADFITTHHYPTDAFGRPGDDTETQLANSRRSVLREQAQDARRRARGKPLYYTEWNASSNPRDPLHDGPYAAAFAVKTVMEASGLVSGYSFWTFTDLFEENYFPSAPFHGGFGLLNLHGIPKPVYHAFALLHRLGTERLLVDGIHPTVDAWAVRGEQSLIVLLTNHALPRHSIETERVSVFLADAPEPLSVSLERLDEDHANPSRLWREMGAPEYLSSREAERLEAASRLRAEEQPFRYEAGTIRLALELPPQAVAAVTVELGAGAEVRGRGPRPDSPSRPRRAAGRRGRAF
jgi:xylan 1,4-beta-xylosidase